MRRVRHNAAAASRGLLRVLQLLGSGLPAEADLVDAEHPALVSGEGTLLLPGERSVEATWDIPAESAAHDTALTDALGRAAAPPSCWVMEAGNNGSHSSSLRAPARAFPPSVGTGTTSEARRRRGPRAREQLPQRVLVTVVAWKSPAQLGVRDSRATV
jgi:hypothetical protein